MKNSRVIEAIGPHETHLLSTCKWLHGVRFILTDKDGVLEPSPPGAVLSLDQVTIGNVAGALMKEASVRTLSQVEDRGNLRLALHRGIRKDNTERHHQG